MQVGSMAVEIHLQVSIHLKLLRSVQLFSVLITGLSILPMLLPGCHPVSSDPPHQFFSAIPNHFPGFSFLHLELFRFL